MKKLIAMLLALVMVLSLAACDSSEPAATDAPAADAPAADAPAATEAATEAAKAYSEMTIDELKPLIETITDGKLTMVTSPDFAPYEFYAIAEDGTPSLAGFDMALAQYIADYLGLTLEVVPMSFNGIVGEMGAGSADLAIAGLSPDPARMDAMAFSDIYYAGGQSFVTIAANADKFPDLASANTAGISVAAQIGSIQMDLANEYSADTEIIPLPKVTDIIAELIAGKLDGAYIETAVAESYKVNYPDLHIVCDVPYDVEGSAVGVIKGNDALLAGVNEAIAAALADGSMDNFVAEANELAAGNIHEGLLEG